MIFSARGSSPVGVDNPYKPRGAAGHYGRAPGWMGPAETVTVLQGLERSKTLTDVAIFASNELSYGVSFHPNERIGVRKCRN